MRSEFATDPMLMIGIMASAIQATLFDTFRSAPNGNNPRYDKTKLAARQATDKTYVPFKVKKSQLNATNIKSSETRINTKNKYLPIIALIPS
jgi:hypothetical protein